MSTYEDRVWSAHQEAAADDQQRRFNAEHGHLAECEFVVDDWLCDPLCR